MTATTTGSTNTSESMAAHIERCYRQQDWRGLGDVYAPDVLLDVHVPQWRFQHQGAQAAIDWFTETTRHMTGFRVTWTRLTTGPGLIAMEWEVRTGQASGADEHLCREIDVFHVDGGRVVEHVIWCTGMWDPATIARQQAEAPMVRW